MEAWNTLREYYNRTTLHNRVAKSRRLHEFKIEEGTPMVKHLDVIDELVVGLQTLGESVDEARQLVVVLNSLPSEYKLIASIVENSKDITLTEFKEKLLKEHERGATSHLTPFREDLFDFEGTVSGIEVTIVDGYGHIDDAKRTKLESKSLFLGYTENAKGYRVYDLEASKITVSRSVKLGEREMGGIYDTPSSQHHGTVIHVTKDGDEGTVPVDEERQSVADEPMEAAEEPSLDVEMNDVEPEMNVEEVMQLTPPERSGSTGLELTPYHPQPEAYQEDRLVFHPEAERSRRSREPVFLLENGQNDGEESRSEGSDGPPSPKRARVDEDGLIPEAVMAYVANIVETTDVPTTYAEAMASHEADEWRKVMNAELYSHEKNATWTLVPRGPDKRIIDCRWVFAKKRDENCRVTHYKARLVAKGLKQKYGIDFFETYSPGGEYELNPRLRDIVYMEVPHGVKSAKGMNGFKSCGADQCVYMKRTKNGFVYVCLYVDDMIIAAKTVGEIDEIDHGMNAGTLMIKQTRYIDDVAEQFGQKDAKPVDNPCSPNLKLSKAQSPGTVEEMQSKPYCSLIGWLLYNTTCTRPGIAYVVTQLSRFLENPGLQNWRAAIRVLRCLKTTREHGILYNGGKNGLKVEAFTDAGWGSNIDDRRSVSGIMVMLGNAPVVFKSKFQKTVALSSAEDEYMAVSLCVQEILWLRAMLKDMGIPQEGATQIWEDNQGATALAKNAGYNSRTKHVDIKHYFTRENVERGTVKADYVDTKHQLADLLTKGLGTKTLKYLNNASGIKAKITVQ
ncbi:Integrase catalytic core protein [Phytophthora palmivora]|uniref:Integrase catalytic core protein n=1 Tax=Phytophthora palmivora TaxID=4796 RepID=A0A2P4XZB3_9STRA|nr:Integrase catalytic core protein [Phytophthora palmivora]